MSQNVQTTDVPIRIVFGILAILCLGLLLKRRSDLDEHHKVRIAPGHQQLEVAMAFVLSNENPEFNGNVEPAVHIAEYFAIGMRLYPGHDASPSPRIPTYCYLQGDSCVILAVVPQLSNLPDPRRREVEEFAWSLLNEHVVSKYPYLKKVAICFRCDIRRDIRRLTLLTGPNAKIFNRLDNSNSDDALRLWEQLLPFFAPP